MGGPIDKSIDRRTDNRQTDSQIVWLTDKQTDGQTGGETRRQTTKKLTDAWMNIQTYLRTSEICWVYVWLEYENKFKHNSTISSNVGMSTHTMLVMLIKEIFNPAEMHFGQWRPSWAQRSRNPPFVLEHDCCVAWIPYFAPLRNFRFFCEPSKSYLIAPIDIVIDSPKFSHFFPPQTLEKGRVFSSIMLLAWVQSWKIFAEGASVAPNQLVGKRPLRASQMWSWFPNF